MEETSTTKEVTAQGTPVYYPWSFHEVIRAILRCLGLEPEFHQNPSCPKKENDGEVNTIQASGCQESPVASSEEGPDRPSSSTTDYSDPPSTVTDPTPDPSSTIGNRSFVVSISTPKRPGTSSGRGSQIN